MEAVFKELNGVTDVRPGYAGGTAATADYRTVSSGRTDHAEVVEVVYDAARIGLGEILKVFFAIAHDPTEVDRQGPDVGRGTVMATSSRSGFTLSPPSPEQRKLLEEI